jgi:hypothetical protein
MIIIIIQYLNCNTDYSNSKMIYTHVTLSIKIIYTVYNTKTEFYNGFSVVFSGKLEESIVAVVLATELK